MKFRYVKVPISPPTKFFGNYVLKPLIPIKISVGSLSINYAALIDSGADFCIFDADIGENLGLDIKKGEEIPFGGIEKSTGKQASAYIHEVILNVGGNEYPTKVGFSYDIAKGGYGILGQKEFFDLFWIKFDLAKQDIEFK